MGSKWYEHPEFENTTCKEGVEFINKNADEFLAELGYVHDRKNKVFHCVKENNEKIALFAHAGFGITFLSSILDIPYPMMCTHFNINHSCITIINFKNNETVVPMVETLSNDSHLFKEDLPTNHFYFY